MRKAVPVSARKGRKPIPPFLSPELSDPDGAVGPVGPDSHSGPGGPGGSGGSGGPVRPVRPVRAVRAVRAVRTSDRQTVRPSDRQTCQRAAVSTRRASTRAPATKAARPSQAAAVSQFSRFSASGASEPPLVTEKAMMKANSTPTRLSPTIRPAANRVPVRSARFSGPAALLPWRLRMRQRSQAASRVPRTMGMLTEGGR